MKTIVNVAGRPVLRDAPKPQPAEGQVLVRISRTAISVGTELYRLRIATADTTEPMGYIAAGVVEEVNKPKAPVKVGDRVFTQLSHGEYGVVDSYKVYPLPEGLNYDAAAASYWAVPALRGIHRLRPLVQDDLAVVGQGAIGLMGLQILRHIAGTLVAVDVDPKRLEMSASLGADLCVNAQRQEPAKVVGAKLREGPAGVLEASGSVDGLRAALEICRPRGTIVTLRIARDLSGLDLNKYMYFKDLSLVYAGDPGMPPSAEYMLDRTPLLDGLASGVYPDAWYFRRDVQTALHMVASGYVQAEPLLSHHVSPEEAIGIYPQLVQPETRGTYLGVIINWD